MKYDRGTEGGKKNNQRGELGNRLQTGETHTRVPGFSKEGKPSYAAGLLSRNPRKGFFVCPF